MNKMRVLINRCMCEPANLSNGNVNRTLQKGDSKRTEKILIIKNNNKITNKLKMEFEIFEKRRIQST